MTRIFSTVLCTVLLGAVAFAATISGTVIESGSPAGAIPIVLQNLDSPIPLPPDIVETDRSGYYSFDRVVPGNYSLMPDYTHAATPSEYRITVYSDSDILTGYDFLIGSTTTDAAIAGRLMFDDGTPGAYRTVYAESFLSGTSFSTTTDVSGNYSLMVAGGDEYYVYPEYIEGYYVEPTDYYVLIASGTEMGGYDFTYSPEIVTDPDAWIEGRITYDDGSPAWDASVYASNDWTGDMYYGAVDFDGRYNIAVVGGYDYYVWCESAGGFLSEPDNYYLSISTGETIGGNDFTFLPDTTTETYSINVYISNRTYTGIGGIMVSCDGSSESTAGYTDAYGNIYFSPTTAGSYTITPSSPFYTFTPISLDVEVSDWEPYAYADFVAETLVIPTYTIFVAAYDTGMHGISSVTIDYKLLHETTWQNTLTGADGTISIIVPTTGDYELRGTYLTGFFVYPATANATIAFGHPTDSVEFFILPDTKIDEQVNLPSHSEISTYPNPFNANVEIDAPSATYVEIINYMGKHICTLEKPSAHGKFIWQPDAGTCAGVYFARTNADSGVSTARLLYIK